MRDDLILSQSEVPETLVVVPDLGQRGFIELDVTDLPRGPTNGAKRF